MKRTNSNSSLTSVKSERNSCDKASVNNTSSNSNGRRRSSPSSSGGLSTAQTLHITAIVASTGSSFEIDVNPSQTGEGLKQQISEETSIEIENQILFNSNGIRIHGGTSPLQRKKGYQLKNNSQLFIFDRIYISQPDLNNTNHMLNMNDFNVKEPKHAPFTSEDEQNHPLYQSSSLLIRLLPRFESDFNHHMKLSNAYYNENIERIKACKKAFQQLQNQQTSLRTLAKHVSLLHKKLNTKFEDFYFKDFTTQKATHEKLLSQFETDLAKLGTIILEPELQTRQRTTLLDCVPENDLRSWHSRCRKSHEQLSGKVNNLQKNKKEIDSKYEGLEKTIKESPVKFADLRQELKYSDSQLDLILEIYNELSNDYKHVKQTIESATQELTQSRDGALSTALIDSPTKFDAANEQHSTKLIPKLQQHSDNIKNVLQHCIDAQEAMTHLFAECLALTAELQKNMVAESNKITALSESLTRKQDFFDQLVKVQKLPESYESCIEEIVERRAFGEFYFDKMNELSKLFEKPRNNEINRRMSFLQLHGSNLPSDLVPGLTNKPGLCEISYQHLEDELPKISKFENKVLSHPTDASQDDQKDPNHSHPKQKEPVVSNINNLVDSKHVVTIKMLLQQKRKEFEEILAQSGFCPSPSPSVTGANDASRAIVASVQMNGAHKAAQPVEEEKKRRSDDARVSTQLEKHANGANGANGGNGGITLEKAKLDYEIEKQRLKREYEAHVERLEKEVNEIKSENDSLRYELSTYNDVPQPPTSISSQLGGNHLDVSNIDPSKLSKMFGIEDPMMLSKASAYMSRIISDAPDSTDSINLLTKTASDCHELGAKNEVLTNELDEMKAELNEYKRHNKQLTFDRRKFEEQLEQQNSQISKLSDTNTQLSSQLESVMETNKEHMDRMQQMEHDFDKNLALRVESELAQQKEQLKQNDTARMEEIESLQTELSKKTEEFDAAQKQVTELSERRNEMLQQIKFLSEVSAEWEQRYYELDSSFTSFKKEKQVESEEYEKQKMELSKSVAESNWDTFAQMAKEQMDEAKREKAKNDELTHVIERMKMSNIYLFDDFKYGDNLLFVKVPDYNKYTKHCKNGKNAKNAKDDAYKGPWVYKALLMHKEDNGNKDEMNQMNQMDENENENESKTEEYGVDKVFLDLEVVHIKALLQGEPGYIVGEVFECTKKNLSKDKYGLKKGESVVNVVAGSLKKIDFKAFANDKDANSRSFLFGHHFLPGV